MNTISYHAAREGQKEKVAALSQQLAIRMKPVHRNVTENSGHRMQSR